MGEYQQEEEIEVTKGAKGEEVEEAPTPTKSTKRKAKAQLVAREFFL